MSGRSIWNPALLGFECDACGARVRPDDVRSSPVCPTCGQPLLARYERDTVVRDRPRPNVARAPGLWRYARLLPFAEHWSAVTLGEGGTPLLPMHRLAAALGLGELWVKEESGNPTQSFKARGLALAVNGARALGRDAIALPSAGNAGSAAAAYAAAAGMRCRVTVPEETPEAFLIEQEALGAEVLRVPGTISDAAVALRTWAPATEWWNVATFREPFRLEGKKTLGYEIAESLGWRLPDVVLYPTGGGTGLVGMDRAFADLISLGWSAPPAPRLVAVQVEGCAPVVRAYDRGAERVEPWTDARTLASGLRVPSPFADRWILRAVRDTGGEAVAVSEEAMLDGMVELTAEAGVFACPEGGATLAALHAMCRSGRIAPGARVVMFDTGSGLKYLEAWRSARARGSARSRAAKTGAAALGTAADETKP
jgi:threonine synthase